MSNLKSLDRFIFELKIAFNKKKQEAITASCLIIVPQKRVELSRPYGHMTLNHACLPIPALGHDLYRVTNVDICIRYIHTNA